MSTTTIRVLHVDDDYSFLTVSKSILSDGPFTVDTATSADEALTQLKNNPYDVLVSDYEMPQKNGLDLLKELRDSGSDIPFILFTGKGREEIAVQALNFGADRYIDKHGDPKVVFTELSVGIRQLYEKSQAKRLLWESEERFRLAVKNAPIVMATLNAKLECTWVYNAMDETVKINGTLIGKHVGDVFKIDNYQKILESLHCLLQTGGHLRNELVIHVHDMPYVLDCSFEALPNKKGEISEIKFVGYNITEHKKIETQLKSSEERWKFALEGAGDGVWDWNYQTNEIFFSTQWRKILGYEENEIANDFSEWERRVQPEDKIQVYAALEKHFSRQTPIYVNEHRLLHKNGSYVWILDRGKVISWTEDGKPLRVIGTHTDITERKNMEVALRESQEQFSAAFSSSGAAIAITSYPDGLVVDANDQFLKLLGYNRAEMIGKTTSDLRLWANFKDREKLLSDISQNLLVENREIIGKRKNGAEVYVLLSMKLIKIKEQMHLLTTLIDITDLKQTEKALFLQRKELENIFEMAPDAVSVIDPDGFLIDCNEVTLNLFGLTDKSQVIGKSVPNFFAEKDQTKIFEAFKRALNGETVKNVLLTGRMLNGHEIDLEGSAKAIFDATGKPTSLVTTLRDISEKLAKERKLAELLSQSGRREENLKEILTISESLLRNTDIKTALQQILTSFQKIMPSELGFIVLKEINQDKRTILFSQSGQIITEKSMDNIDKFCSTICLNGKATFINNFKNSPYKKLVKRMPFPIPSNVAIIPISLNQATIGFIGLANKQDGFTEDDKLMVTLLAEYAEIALENNVILEKVAKSEMQMRAITDSAKDAIITTDPQGRISFWSTAAVRMFGYSTDEAIGLNFHKVCTPSRFHLDYEHSFAEFQVTGTGFVVGKTIELIGLRKNGDEFPLELSLSVFKLGEGWNAVGVVRDITERKKTEQKLKESEERYRYVAEHANDIITVTDVNGVFKYVSPSMMSVAGINPETLIGKKSVLELLPPEVVTNFNPKMAQLVQTGKLHPLQFQLNTPKGLLWLETNINIVQDEFGQITFNAISRNITERKIMEDQLRESEERYRFVADFAQDLITVSDLQENYLYVSPSVERLLGYKPEELIGKVHILDHFHTDDIENFREHIQTLLAKKDLPPVEFRYQTKSGHYVWLEAKISTVQDTSGITKFIGISRDVTQRNKDREELDKALSQAKLLLEKLSVVGGFVRHDIRNKLTNITNILYLSKKQVNNNPYMLTQIESIDAAVKSTVRILEFSQTYEAVGSQGLSWIKVVGAIQEAKALSSGGKDLQINTEELDYEVLADSALTEIFHNLIDNSIKYGGPSLTCVKVHAEIAADQCFRLIYEDNGMGIDPSIKPKLFQKGVGKGTGLGLYLIGRICDVYGWTVQEDGIPGMGVRFILEIPRLKVRQL